MIDELDPLRSVRAATPEPTATARAAARRAWDGEPVALTPARSFDRGHSGRRFVVRTAIALTAAAALVAAGLIVTGHRINSVKPKHVVALGPHPEVAPGAPETFLLIGTDSRAFVHTAQQAQEFGSPTSVIGQRSDTMVLVRVDPGSHRVLAVSLPRDLLVDVPGCGTIKLNAVINSDVVCGAHHGGTALLVDTIATDLHVAVDHVVEINFVDFGALVDDLGGVRVSVTMPVRDTYSGLDLAPGCHTLDGAQALSFVRSRHLQGFVDGMWQMEPGSDLARMVREQLALRQLASAAIARAGTDPRPLLRTLFDHVTVDDHFTADDALVLFDALRSEHDATTLTLPIEIAHDGQALVPAPAAAGVLDVLAGRTSTLPALPAGPGGGGVTFPASAC